MTLPMCHSLPYGHREICFQLIRRERRTLAIHVHPDMSIEVVAPHDTEVEKIYSKVRKRARWITRQICFFQQFHPKMHQRKYVSGETHRYLGRQYRLKVELNIQASVKISGNTIVVRTHYPKRPEITKQLLEDWLYARAKEKFKERLKHCLGQFKDASAVMPTGLIVRQMSYRWGSMTPAGNLVLNWRLIQASIPCIDYVITHELCHQVHPHHGKDFWYFVDQVFPDWKKYKHKLEKDLA